MQRAPILCQSQRVCVKIIMHQHMDYASFAPIAVGKFHYVHLIILHHILFLHARAPASRRAGVAALHECSRHVQRLRAGIMRAGAFVRSRLYRKPGAYNVVFTCDRARAC